MPAITSRAVSAAVTLTLLFATRALADPTTDARPLLDFCIAHPEACSLSVHYTKGSTDWEVDYQGTRLNILASTVKVVHLLTYADAAGAHRLDPLQQVNRNDWTQFWIGQDGGALNNAYTRFSQGLPAPPVTVSNDQIVSAMIRESDNAAPDYLLNKLGSDAFAQIVQRYIANNQRVGYVDLPKSINATFATWVANPDEPKSGPRLLGDYSGFESDEFRDELDQMFARMRQDNFVHRIRQFNGSNVPWDPPLPPGQAFQVTDAQYESLEKGYFMRSNTRTYTQLMVALLRRNLLPPATQAIVEKFLEYRLALGNPLLAPLDRYGVKDGSLGSFNGTTIRTRTGYAEKKDDRTQVAFTVHLAGVPGSATDLSNLETPISNFLLAVDTDPVFAAEVKTRLSAVMDATGPNLVARVVDNKTNPAQTRLDVEITNIGTAPTQGSLLMALYISDDHTVKGSAADQGLFGRLEPGQSARVELQAKGKFAGKFAVLVIDPDNRLPAGQKQNNPQFERIRAKN